MIRRVVFWPVLAALTGMGTLLAGSQYNCEPIEPVEPIECRSSADCVASDATDPTLSSQFCNKDDSDCDGIGVCEDRPVVSDCPRLWAPVCGCDDVTYDNWCFANVAGTSIASDGECQVQPDYCWSNDMCAGSEYCYFSECAAETGTCLTRPEACIALYDPVCGCDGETYSNSCYAASAGVSVDYEGECDITPQGCWSDDMCAEGSYCFYADCAVETGGCAPVPDACYYLWDPVCGCDGETYANDCLAATAHVSIDYEGECR